MKSPARPSPVQPVRINRMSAAPPLISALAALSGGAFAAVLTNPTILNQGTPFNGNYTAAKLFDGNRDTEYASAGGGAPGTWVEMDFGAPVSLDRMILVTRNNNADVVGGSRLIYSTDPVFDGSDPYLDLGAAGHSGIGNIASFSSITSRYVKWQVTVSSGFSQNLGGMELRFLNTPAGTELASAAVIGGYPAFNGDYAVGNAANGILGGDYTGREYATNGGGSNNYVDFDFGSTIALAGFDFFDRMASADRTAGFDLIFSNVADFSITVDTKSFAAGSDWGYGQTFTPVNARFVRFDATTAVGNPGMQEMIFYKAIPEPSVSMLGIGMLGVGLLIRRRS